MEWDCIAWDCLQETTLHYLHKLRMIRVTGQEVYTDLLNPDRIVSCVYNIRSTRLMKSIITGLFERFYITKDGIERMNYFDARYMDTMDTP